MLPQGNRAQALELCVYYIVVVLLYICIYVLIFIYIGLLLYMKALLIERSVVQIGSSDVRHMKGLNCDLCSQ